MRNVWRPRLAGPAGTGGLVLSAVVQSFSTLGSGLVNSGVPLRPGDVFEADVIARKIRVFVNGVEQAVYCEALNGRFADGSVRSVHIQFQYNIPSLTAITAEIHIGEVRLTADVAFVSVTDTVMTARRFLIVTDVEYLCQTWATFERLLPASLENTDNARYFTTLANERFTGVWPYPGHFQNVIGKDYDLTGTTGGGATYEHVRSLYAHYMKSGNRDFYDNAHQRGYRMLTGYALPATSYTNVNPHPNENGLPGVSPFDGPPEWHSQKYLGFGVAYLYTGCIEYWNIICERNCSLFYGKTTLSTAMMDFTNAQGNFGWVDDTYICRFNLSTVWCTALGVILDCTKTYGFTGKYGMPAQFSQVQWQTRLPWILDAWEFHKYVSGYRAGFRGNRETSTNGGTLPAGEAPHFQWAQMAAFLVFWYENVHADSRLPGWIKAIVDPVWDNNMFNSVGFNNLPIKAYNYFCISTPGSTTGEDPYSQTMWAGPVSFLKAFYGDAKYSTNYLETINVNHVKPPFLFWSWKIWGENFGQTMGAPYRSQVGIPTGLPSSIRAPVLY